MQINITNCRGKNTKEKENITKENTRKTKRSIHFRNIKIFYCCGTNDDDDDNNNENGKETRKKIESTPSLMVK